ncbi:MAG: RluA family pseudouridine synthase [Treponema sp.]|nr:RluA family pseudouridine synthase [Treponema sp.]
MDFKDFRAGRDDDSKRIDHILARILDGFGNARIQEAIRKRLVRLNNLKTTPGQRVQEGDIISVATFLVSGGQEIQSVEKKSAKSSGGLPTPDVVFKNEHILIINKPRGISAQPSMNGETSLSELISKLYPGEKDSLSFRIGPLHRLDKNTSGLMAFSQSSTGAKWFSDAMGEHKIKKTYLGIAEGRIEKPETWVDFLSESKTSGGFHKMELAREKDLGREAVTHATPLAHGKNQNGELTLVQFDIETGRKHQIRCQSMAHGHPLMGDCAYNGHGKTFYLHAARLTFPDDNPIGLPPQICCEIPNDFKKNLDLNLLNWDGQLIIFH